MRPVAEWVIVESPELKIIDDVTWKACEARARSAKRDTAAKQSIGKGPGGRGPKFLFSGLLKCGVCGGAYVIQGRKDYGCATHQNRGASVCSNGLKVKRSTIEQVLLTGVKDSLLSDDAYRAFESEARALLKQAKPDPAAARHRLGHARKELDNLMAAISAGIITPTSKGPVHVIHGFVSGKLNASTVAGSSVEQKKRLEDSGLNLATSVGDNYWTAEFRIPLKSIGIVPVKDKKLQFNIATRQVAANTSLFWTGTFAQNWRVEDAGELIFK
jgi:hypothetical protein